MASITSLGVGAGLPLQDTLDKLADVERERLKPISKQQTNATNKQKAYEQLKTSLTAFQTANTELSKVDLYSGTKSSSSNSDIAVTTTANVPPGKYTVKVTQLAQAQTLATKIVNSTADVTADEIPIIAVGSDAAQRTLTIKNGSNDVNITLNKDQMSLQGIRDAINNANSGISASLIKVSKNGYQLLISPEVTGTEREITSIQVTGDTKLSELLNYNKPTGSPAPTIADPIVHMTQIVEAKNAQLSINNVSIERQSNTITDAPEGMTLTISKESQAIISVDKNTDATKSAVKNWVNSYNALLKTISDLTVYSPVDPGSKSQNPNNGPLIGDSIVITMKSKIRDQFISKADDSHYKMLTNLGIKTTDFITGKMELNESKLDKALADNPLAVRDLLAGKLNNETKKYDGVAARINDVIDGYLSSRGTIKTMEDGLSRRLTDLQKQYDMVNNSINDRIASYKKQFTQLDKMVKQMDNLSKYLTQQFEALKKSTG